MRDIATGYSIPDEGYCDQPYVVITRDGNWLCLLTTAGGTEGAANSHVVSTISADQGRTWSELVELEPVDGPPSVYSLPVVARTGRVYAFYDYNGDNFKCPARSDCVGWFVLGEMELHLQPNIPSFHHSTGGMCRRTAGCHPKKSTLRSSPKGRYFDSIHWTLPLSRW